MSDEISVGDTMYVSSKRASDISGYAQDYIGQLARKSLIEAKRIGGLWYVDMRSLESYNGRPQPLDLDERKEAVKNEKNQDSIVSFDGKDYISANRASKITGYNQDYVGQLARSGKIISRQVGNRWFVDREGILAHKNEKDSLLAAVQVESVGVHQDSPDLKEESTSARVIAEPQLLNYISEKGHLIPHIEERSSSAIKSVNDYGASYETETPHEIPIQVMRKASVYGNIPRNRRIPLVTNSRKTTKTASKTKIPLSVGILILSVVLIGSFAAVLFIPGSGNQGSFQSRLSMTANAITSISGSVFNNIASAFEGLIQPELIYTRS